MSMRETRNRELVEKALAALNAHDLDAFQDLVATGYSLYDVRLPNPVVGPGEVRAYYEQLQTALPNFKLEPMQTKTSGYAVYQELRLRGRHDGPIELPDDGEVQATGKTVALNIEAFHHFNYEGELINTIAYLSLTQVMEQLGIEP